MSASYNRRRAVEKAELVLRTKGPLALSIGHRPPLLAWTCQKCGDLCTRHRPGQRTDMCKRCANRDRADKRLGKRKPRSKESLRQYRSQPHVRVARANRNAEEALKVGRGLAPPKHLPYRALARTCHGCGELVTTPDELLRRDSGRGQRCSTCEVAAAKEYVQRRESVDEAYRERRRVEERRRTLRTRHRIQAETLERARNYRKLWTGPELEVLLREDLSHRQAALLLGRTYNAVKAARAALRYPKYDNLAGASRL